MALRRGTAHGGGHASADDSLGGFIRRSFAGAKWRAGALGGPLEIRLQEHQIHRESPLRRDPAAHLMEQNAAFRVRLLLQRQSGSRSSTLESRNGAAHR